MLHRAGYSLLVCCLLAGGSQGHSAEIQLKSQALVRGKLVLLREVADVVSQNRDESQQLARIELFSAPETQRYVTAREVQDALVSRGVDLGRHTISGASVIELRPAVRLTSEEASDRWQDSLATRSPGAGAEEKLAAAIRRFLKSSIDANQLWEVNVSLSLDQAMAVADADKVALAKVPRQPRRGDVRPWLGRQRFRVRWSLPKRTLETTVQAHVTLPPTIVVASRDLPRGAALQGSDLRLKTVKSDTRDPGGFTLLEDVVDRELLRPARAGQALRREMIREPLLVRRGGRVTVTVNHGNVRVRTEGRARESGARGDLITVESPFGRKTFRAVVRGRNQVQIDAATSSALHTAKSLR